MVIFDVTDCPDLFNLSNLMKKSSSFSVSLSTIIGTKIAPVPPPKFILMFPDRDPPLRGPKSSSNFAVPSIKVYRMVSYSSSSVLGPPE